MIVWRNACIAWALFVALAAQAANVGAASAALPVLVPQRVAPDIYFIQGKAGVASRENHGFN